MFGLSVSKIILLALVILAVWYGFKYLSQATGEKAPAKAAAPRKDRAERAEQIEDMVRCPSCGAYRSTGPGACATPGCPG